jgi:hypothetical protein
MMDLSRSSERDVNCRACGGKQAWGTKLPNSRHDMETDVNLAKEMNKLSVQEREKILDNIHGVAKAQEETPEMLEKSPTLLDKALATLSRSIRKALDRAFFLRPELKNDRRLKLMFLQAEYISNADLSAKRMAFHFKHQLELFGEDKLVTALTLKDL